MLLVPTNSRSVRATLPRRHEGPPAQTCAALDLQDDGAGGRGPGGDDDDDDVYNDEKHAAVSRVPFHGIRAGRRGPVSGLAIVVDN